MENSQATIKKIGPISLAFVFMAYFCSITAVPTGALVGQGSDFITGLTGMILGFVIGAALIALATWIGYRTGKGKDAVWKQMFGSKGFKVCSFLVAFCMAFWACFDLFNAAQAVYNLMPAGLQNFGFALAMVILLVVTILGGVFGMDGVKLISNLSIPFAIVLFVIIYFVSVKHAGGAAGLMAYQPSQTTYTIGSIAEIMTSMWFAGYCGAIDLTTRAKNTKSVVIAAIAGSGFVLLCFLVGQVGFIGTGVHTLADICAHLGGAIFIIGSIFVMIAQGNTTPACDYMYSNSFQAVFNLKSRTVVAIVVPLIAGALAFVIMYGPGVDFITVIVNTIGTLMAPLLAVTLADFYAVRKRNLKAVPDEQLPAVDPVPLACLAAGVVLSLIFKALPGIPTPTFIVLIVTFVLYTAVRKFVPAKIAANAVIAQSEAA
ncbi:MAG: cytosine permease [Firmicutes bacterium]|nr:cytosine permease [Bacillota bacterium]MBR5925961.1 cytosine permease [Bacillota bacterium]